MRHLRAVTVVPLLLALLVACRGSPPAVAAIMGSVQVAVTTSQALSSGEISRISVTTSAADVPAITIELAKTDGKWGGVIADIPAGAKRIFLAQAFDSSGSLRYEGRVDNVTIVAGEVTLVSLTLQEISTSTPYSNEAPIIDSVVASPLLVAPGANVALMASAHDPNMGDALTISWTAASGIFATPTELSTTWTAPIATGPVSLKLTVSDSHGASSSVTLMVRVSAGEGGAVVDVSFNTPPKVVSLTSSQSYLDVGHETTLSASAFDADGDSLTYSWTASCEGAFEGASTSIARFTPTVLPTAACNNCKLNVAVSDGRGGKTTGTLALCVATGSSRPLPPTIVRSYQSSLTAGPSQDLTFEVVAEDPAATSLTFAWSAPAGTVATPAHTATSTRVVWTAPGCMASGGSTTVTATVTNAVGLSSKKTFTVAGLPSCPFPGTWTVVGSMNQPRNYHTLTTLPSGKVLAAGTWTSFMSIADTAELYDPATREWTPLARMPYGLWNHTATLLHSGKVLITRRGVAMLFDPTTNTWAATGRPIRDREGHSALLLPSGKVLVTGGQEGGVGPLTQAELYDPETATWSLTGSMASPRLEHTLTLLPSGKVLAVGGDLSYLPAEIYDPATGLWTSTSTPAGRHRDHTATLLPSGKVLVFGSIYFSPAELYDPATGTWALTGNPSSTPREAKAVLLPSGKVLTVSGSSRRAELYDYTTGSWTPAGATESVYYYGSRVALLQTGQVLLTGELKGDGTTEATTKAELYTP